MFSHKDRTGLLIAALLVAGGFTLMAADPVDNGFGILTLWIAPFFLVAGFLLVIPCLTGWDNLSRLNFSSRLRSHRADIVGACMVFVISGITYTLTLEPTASLWDCGEFIACAFKLQVPHTPGTPLLLLLGRIFSMLALGDVTNVAWSVNLMSAFFSAGTVGVLFLIITNLIRNQAEKCSFDTAWLGGVAGSLTLAFSDTFWFSAVEAETYAAACFCMVTMIWLMLNTQSKPEAQRMRYTVILFYLAGLSYCIHPMSLLVLPLYPVVWGLNRYRLSWMNVSLLFILGTALVLGINRFIVVGTFEAAFFLDLLLVNTFGLPFYAGVIVLFLSVTFLTRYLIIRYRRFQGAVYCAIFLTLGFAPYGMLFIRSGFNPPIDQSNPQNLPLAKAYMNREGYPTRPLIYGPYFDAQVEDVSKERDVYQQKNDRYELAGAISQYHYTPSRQTLLPRIYSSEENHVESYRAWTGLGPSEKPGFIHNIHFMLRYQLGHMYWRYLMFNFSGRESDEQNASWLKPWDSLHKTGPHQYQSKARNQYWMLPFLAGLAGAYIQFRRKRKDFVIVMLFFLVSGAGLALYLNSTPNEPRERDYIYVGSYIAFSVWVGFGVSALCNLFKKHYLAAPVAMILPILLLITNYNDHDRSGRTFQIDNARNMLASLPRHALLFTGGDNDTFPLWYLQDVEGFRTDVRVLVLSYMNTDWYINQLRKAYYDSPPLNLTLSEDDYHQYGPNDVLYVQEMMSGEIDARKYLQLLRQNHKALELTAANGERYHVVPGKTLRVNLQEQRTTSMQTDAVATSLDLAVNGRYLHKNSLAILDILASNGSARPLYFNFTSITQTNYNLAPYLVQEGQVYRLSSVKSKGKAGRVDTEKMFKNLVIEGDYSNLSDTEVYFNYEDFQMRIINPLRQSFNMLALALLEEGKHDQAKAAMDTMLKCLYPKNLLPSFTNLQTAEILIAQDRPQDAHRVAQSLFDFCFSNINYQLETGKDADEFDASLLHYSAGILAKLDDHTYEEKIRSLGIE